MPYIRDLMAQRSIPDEPRPGHAEDSLMLERVFDVIGSKFVCRHEASEFLDWLLALNMQDGSQPPPAKPAARPPYRRRYPARPSNWTPNAPPRTGRSDRDVAREALAVARQLAAQPGVKERMRLVEQIAALEEEVK